MIEIFKMCHELYDPQLPSLLTFSSNRNTRGHRFKLETKTFKKAPRKHFFTVRSVKSWNSLPESVVDAPTLNTFKNRLDRFWNNQEVLYDFEAALTGSAYATAENCEMIEVNTEVDVDFRSLPS